MQRRTVEKCRKEDPEKNSKKQFLFTEKMGLTESTYCGSNRKASAAKENVEYVKVVRRYEDEELLEQLANGVKRGGRGRRKNRRANRMLRRARAELINLKLGTDRKVSSMKREIEELNEYIEEMKRKGERVRLFSKNREAAHI